MNKKSISTLAILSLAFLAACATQTPTDTSLAREFVPPDAPSLTRVSDEAAVVVDITPLNLDRAQGELAFQVGLNTHSVDLSYDLSQMAVLRTSHGVEITALTWEGPTTGGHHVSGLLTFPAVELSGAEWIEVVVMGVADVPERTFRWELAS
jgi:hypothetical protein